MENTKLKKVKIGLIVCIVFLAVFAVILGSMKKDKKEITNVGSIEVTVTEKSVTVRNFDEVLSRLPMKSITMHNKIQDFALTYLKKIYHNLARASQNEIKAYYEANQAETKNFLYNANLENFEKLVEQISKLKSKTLTYKENSFDIETMKKSNKEYSFEMRIRYQDEEELKYCVHITKGNDDEIDQNEIWFEPIL